MKTPKPKFLILLICFLAFSFNTATAQTYDPYAVQVINNLIKNNGLNAIPNAPETWTFATWNNETPKKVLKLEITHSGLTGTASFAGIKTLQTLYIWFNNLTGLDLTNCIELKELACDHNVQLENIILKNCINLQNLYYAGCNLPKLDLTPFVKLQKLDCSYNKITKLDITNLKQLITLDCSDNKLTKLDITNCTKLESLYCGFNQLTELELSNCKQLSLVECMGNRLTKLNLTGLTIIIFGGAGQNVSLCLYENDIGEYTYPITLNNPIFSNNAISYTESILKSTDNTVDRTGFSVQTIGNNNYRLYGYMNFTYRNVGINAPESIHPKVYPNPTKDSFFIDSEMLGNVMLYDMLGKKILTQNVSGKTEINISHLPKGIYIVAVFSEGKLMGNAKIVKQ